MNLEIGKRKEQNPREAVAVARAVLCDKVMTGEEGERAMTEREMLESYYIQEISPWLWSDTIELADRNSATRDPGR